MYNLEVEKSLFYRVKRGQKAQDIEKMLCIPVPYDVFDGMIIKVPQADFIVYKAEAGETYRSIALKFGVSEEEIKKINGNRSIYPTCRLFIPR